MNDLATVATDDLIQALCGRFDIMIFMGRRGIGNGRTIYRFRSSGDGHACAGLALDAAARTLEIVRSSDRPLRPGEPGT